MKHLGRFVLLTLLAFGIAACGGEKDSAERNLEAQKAIQEGMQKEKQMYEGMQKGMESVEKKMEEQKEEPRK
jgi:methanogenic corrinoid protein MtbC1